MIPLLVAACQESPEADRARLLEGLRTGECAGVHADELRDECWLGAVALGAAECERILDERRRGECWFRVAEREADATLCVRAGSFADDCALHVLSAAFPAWVPSTARPGEGEDEVVKRIAASGLSPDDPRPWSAYYRWILGLQKPLDRGSCAAVALPLRRDACTHTGIALYHDRLNFARDKGIYPCDGGELPALLQHSPDPELDAARAARTDLCSR